MIPYSRYECYRKLSNLVFDAAWRLDMDVRTSVMNRMPYTERLVEGQFKRIGRNSTWVDQRTGQ